MLLGHESFGQSIIKITIVCIKVIIIYLIVILIYIRQYTLHNCICCKFWINRLSKFHLVQFTPDKPQLPRGPIITWIRGFGFLTVANTWYQQLQILDTNSWKPDTNRDFSSYQIQQLKTSWNQGRVWWNSITSLAWGLVGMDFTVGQILIFWDRWFERIESKLRRLRLSNAGPSHWPSTGPKPNQRPFTDATCTHCSLNQNQQEPHHRHDHRRLSIHIF